MAIARLTTHDANDMLHVPARHITDDKSPDNSHSLLSFAQSPVHSPRGASKSLANFRSSLVESHAILLKQLDQSLKELEKENSPCASKTPSIPGRSDPRIPSEPQDQPRLLEGQASSKRPSVEGIIGRTLPPVADSEDEVEDVSSDDEGTLKGRVINRQLTETFTTLTDVDEKRKKNMVWIQKNNRVSLIDEVYDEFEPGVASMSRQQKAEAAKDARKRFGESGAFVHLSPEHVESVVHQAAFQRFGSQMDLPESVPGLFARIASHRWFERVALLLTLSNVIYISLDVEFNYSGLVTRASVGFIVADNIFCTLFLSELLIRFLSYSQRLAAFKDTAFLFDTILVAMMMLESWFMPLLEVMTAGESGDVAETSSILRIARVMRILRTARIAKLVRYMPELVILLKGMLSACRSVFFTLLLLILVTYVFAITITEVSRGTSLENDLFSGLWHTILTLIVQCVMPDLEARFKDAALENWFVGLLWLTFIMFGTYIVMGLLVGILVETVKTVATFERKQLDIDFAQNVLWELITETCADQDGDNRISQVEFAQLLARREAAKALTALGVDVSSALDYGHLLFEDGEPLTFAEFMEGMMTLRGSNQTTVKDMVDLRKFTAEEFSNLHAVLLDICNFLQSQGMTIDSLQNVKHSVRYSRASRMTQRITVAKSDQMRKDPSH